MKKAFVFILTVVIILALMPALALAADATLTVGSGEAYTTIQAAVDAAGTGTTTIIVKPGTYSETVQVLQQVDKNIVIQGEDGVVMTGGFIIDGGGRYTGAETIAIKNIDFDRTGATASGVIIDLKKFVSVTYSYTHNVTIEDCSFTGSSSYDIVAIQAGSSGGNTAYNTVVKNCTFTTLHSIMQARCQGITIDNITASGLSSGGLNIQNSSDLTITNSKIEAANYAIRAGQSGTGTDASGFIHITNCILICSGAEGAVNLRGTFAGDVVITSSDMLGNVIKATLNPVTLTTNLVYWGAGYGAIGFEADEMTISNNLASPNFDDTEVTAGVDPTYIIMIPSSVDFGTLVKDSGIKTKDFIVSAQSVLIESGAKIDVNVDSISPMTDGTNDLPYILKNSTGDVAALGLFAEFDGDGTEAGTVRVDTGAIVAAGAYSGTMVFGISYVSP